MNKKFFLKRILPGSLFARFLAISILPWIFFQVIIIYIFFDRHWEGVNVHMINSVASDIAMISKLIEDPKNDINNIIDISSNILKLPLRAIEKPIVIAHNKSELDEPINNLVAVINKISPHIKCTFRYDEIKGDIKLSFQVKNQHYQINVPKKRIATPTISIFIAWNISSAIILLIVSILFMRNQVRSITKLADAAENFVKGQDITNFKPEGAKEVRIAGRNFIKMKEMIEEQLNQHTVMMAGVSHDLKTPLTRIKLQIAMMEKRNELDAINEDVAEIEYMINEYLDLISSSKASEASEEIDIVAMVEDIVKKYLNPNIELNLPHKSIVMLVQPFALKRAITNIIDNAIKYGNLVYITFIKSSETVKIIIEDDGPGIKADECDKIFRPFYRADYARNLNKSGAGLGLAISSNIINTHGGNIYIAKRNIKLKGASFVIEVPY